MVVVVEEEEMGGGWVVVYILPRCYRHKAVGGLVVLDGLCNHLSGYGRCRCSMEVNLRAIGGVARTTKGQIPQRFSTTSWGY